MSYLAQNQTKQTSQGNINFRPNNNRSSQKQTENVSLNNRSAYSGSSFNNRIGEDNKENSQKNNLDMKEDLTHLRSNKIALIFWAMINNNVITTTIFCIMLIIDYVFQTLIILCIYNEFDAIPIDMKKFASLIEMDNLDNNQVIQNIVIFSHCMLLIAAFVIFVFKNNKEEYFKEKNVIFKVLSFGLALFRTFILTFYLIMLTNNIMNFNDTLSLRFLEIFFLVMSFILIILITYFQANFLNICVPNIHIPWSETSPQPLLIENLYKLALGLVFRFRDNIALRYTFLIFSIGLLGYKIFLRIRKSFMFSKAVFNCSIIGETFLLHLLFIILPAKIFMKQNYILFALADLISFFLLLAYVYKQFRINWVLNNTEEFDNENEKMFGYLQILEFYTNNTFTDMNYISQIHFNHQLKCRSYFKRLDKRLIRNVRNKNKNNQFHKTYNDDEFEMKPLIKEKFSMPLGSVDDIDSCNYNIYSKNISKLQNEIEEVKQQNLNNSCSDLDLSTIKVKTPNGSSQSKNNGQGGNTIFSKKSDSQIQMYQKGKDGFYKKGTKSKNKLNSLNIDNERKSMQQQYAYQRNNNEFEINYKNQKRREKNQKGLIKHFFKHHLITEKVKDYKIDILKIYFTIKLLKNNLLGHFLLFNFINNIQQDNFIIRTIKILHQMFYETILSVKNQQEEQLLKQINLEKMLELNQLYARFEQQLDQVSTNIYKFWNNLINEKETQNIYYKGIQISDGVKNVQKVYNEIELKQDDRKELKVYLLMGAFYKLVLFKNEEYMLEMQKSRQASQTRKLARDYKDKEISGEKGLIIANLNLKKPMSISFANKYISKMLDYDQNDMVNMKVNQIMPSIISENHHKFIDRFMITGKNRFLANKVQLFLKNKSGHILPSLLYLNVNHQNVKTMILLVEENDSYNIFEEEEKENMALQQTSYCLLDQQLVIHEMTKSMKSICGLTQNIITCFQQNEGYNARIDDMFFFSQQDLNETLKQKQYEYMIQIKFENLLLYDDKGEYENSDIINTKKKSDKQLYQVLDLQQSTVPENLNFINSTFNMKFIPLNFLDGSIQIFIVGIQRVQQQAPQMSHISHALQQKLNQNILLGTRDQVIYGQEYNLNNHNIQQTALVRSNDPIGSYSDQDNVQEFDLSSQTSTSSSSMSLMQKFNHYNNSLNSSKTPSTLKFILQLVLIVILLVITASTVTLILTQNNFNDANSSIDVSNEALQRLNSLSTTRVMIRNLFNIAMDYVPNQNALLPDQFSTYCKILNQVLEDMRVNQLILDTLDMDVANSLGQVKLKFLTVSDSVEIQSRYISQAAMIYIGYGFDIIYQALSEGKQILESSLQYFTIEITEADQASQIERKGYFLLENSNLDLYNFMEDYAQTYNDNKQEAITDKINFQSIMTWICIGIVMLCCIIIIPLFGMIQYRVQYLMRIFFNIKKEQKVLMIDRLRRFQNILLINSKNNQTNTRDYFQQMEDKQESITNEQNSQSQQHSSKGYYDQKGKNNQENEQEEQKQENLNSNQSRQKTFKNKSMKNKKSNKNKQNEENNNNEDQIQSQEISSHNSEKKKKSKKSKRAYNYDMEGYNQNPQNQNQVSIVSDMEQSFNKIIRSQLIKQSLVIFLITCVFASYFLGTYFLSQNDFDTLTESVDVLFLLFYRQSCVENVIHGVTETIVFNKIIMVNDGENEMMSYFQDMCYDMENQYQNQIRKYRPEYLSAALDYLEFLESGQFCDQLYGPNGVKRNFGNVTPELCKTYHNGLVTTGLTNIFQTVYKVSNQIRLEYFKEIEKSTTKILSKEFVLNRLKNLTPLLNIIEVILGQPMNDLIDLSIKSMDDYIGQKQLTFILIYAIFIFVTVLVLLVFLFNIFRKLKREMLLSNRLLYIIDFELTSEEERVVITKFLNKF